MKRQELTINVKSKLAPTRLDDKAIDQKDQVKILHEVLVPRGAGHVSAFVGDSHCLIHQATDVLPWHYYHLPKLVSGYTIEQNGTRLWFITGEGKLASLDLQNSEWFEFQHSVPYVAALYAHEDKVVVYSDKLSVIDVLEFQNDTLSYVTNVPIERISPQHYLKNVVFLPDEERFLVLESTQRVHESKYALLSLGWDGKADVVLNATGIDAKLSFPFITILDKNWKELIYVDLRKTPVEPKHLTLHFNAEEQQQQWSLENAFVSEGELVVVVSNYNQSLFQRALIRLGESPEVLLHETRNTNQKMGFLTGTRTKRFGRFLLSEDGLVYDHVSRKVVDHMSQSAMLRQALHDEARQQQTAPVSTKLPSIASQYKNNIPPDTFRVLIRPSSVHTAEVTNMRGMFSNVSSSLCSFDGDVALVRKGRVHLLLDISKKFHYVFPEPEDGWSRATFDEHGQIWLCNERGNFIAFASPSRNAGLGFVMSPWKANAKAIAAGHNSVAIVLDDESLMLYRYDGQSLIREKRWKSKREIVGVKPDLRGGWWIVTKGKEWSHPSSILSHLAPNSDYPKKVMQLPYQVQILGDWPTGVYFVYIDRDHRLCFTPNPQQGWQNVSLSGILRGSRRLLSVSPIALHSEADSMFVFLCVDDTEPLYWTVSRTWLLVHLESHNIELVSAFSGQWVDLVRLKNWLVLYSKEPIVAEPKYARKAKIAQLPQNEGLLCYHPARDDKFFIEPVAQCSFIKGALYNMINNKNRGFPRFIL